MESRRRRSKTSAASLLALEAAMLDTDTPRKIGLALEMSGTPTAAVLPHVVDSRLLAEG